MSRAATSARKANALIEEYAALHRCHPIARAQGIFADVSGTHARAIEALTGSRDRQLKSIGWRLTEAEAGPGCTTWT